MALLLALSLNAALLPARSAAQDGPPDAANTNSANTAANSAAASLPASADVSAAAPASAPASAAAGQGSAASSRISPAHIRSAVESTRGDPNLGGITKQRVRQFKPSAQEDSDAPNARPHKANWLRDLSLALSNTGRVLMWVLGIILVAMAAVMLRHWVRLHADAAPSRELRLPSHVLTLDIRPESLPDDVGAAASQRWRAGQHREALSLLYRGALSRLVHGHALPIAGASTEGECLHLAERAWGRERAAYFAQLVAVWQAAGYADHLPTDHTALALCEGFDRGLPRQSARPAAEGAPA